MTFVGVGFDGSQGELDGFVSDGGVGGFMHITSESHPDLVNDWLAEYLVSAIPTFVLSNENGQQRDAAGWNEADLREDLQWLIDS